MENQFRLNFTFHTAKAGKKDGEVLGSSGKATCHFASDDDLETVKTYIDEMKSIAYKSIFDHKGLKNRGSIIDIVIDEVTQIENIEE